jgi:hypothetical protein
MAKSKPEDNSSVTRWKGSGFFTVKQDNYGRSPISETIENMEPGFVLTEMIRLNTRKSLLITRSLKRKKQRNPDTGGAMKNLSCTAGAMSRVKHIKIATTWKK